ncbi:MAG: SAM-dependent methyltransferase [Paludibacteraceae bacterium]|nr:SAM-dependent methyltransferase [Paludibacteraceae bacterium]
MVSAELIYTHRQDQVENLALHRSKYADLSDDEWRFFLQQIEGYQRTKDKLPLLAERGWWYPPRLSCEQCSSEATAKYKAGLVKGKHLIDLTGGAGVDTYFMSEKFETADYVEQSEELCRLAEHNLPEKVTVHHTTAEDFLTRNKKQETGNKNATIYIDPARRDKNGGKVFRLADCTPNVVTLLPKMREVADNILIKLSPMLDITQAEQELGDGWQVHVVAVKNEVKEVLLVNNAQGTRYHVTCVDLAEGWQFEFSKDEEEQTISQFANYPINQGYIYEPSVAILKAGAYKLVGARYGLRKLDVNTHLYVSDRLVEDFPGRIFRIRPTSVLPQREEGVRGGQFNVLTRNYVMGAEELKKKLKVKDGGTQYIIGTRVSSKPILLMAEGLKIRP